ncbi:MAG: helix-turn-helix transcriptional regulator [Oscillibacter sp.]|nr:helix-turn-helix transcriptional regulator [Oscillibacter sp.]
MDLLTIMGQRIKDLRNERKLKQSDMAKVLEVTPNHYQKIEYGKVNISAKDLYRLADCFDVSVDYLLGRTDHR